MLTPDVIKSHMDTGGPVCAVSCLRLLSPDLYLFHHRAELHFSVGVCKDAFLHCILLRGTQWTLVSVVMALCGHKGVTYKCLQTRPEY